MSASFLTNVQTCQARCLRMDFYNYRIDLDQNPNEVILKTEDDWYQLRWFEIDELKDANLSEPTRNTLIATGTIAN